jgi:SSS family transporter
MKPLLLLLVFSITGFAKTGTTGTITPFPPPPTSDGRLLPFKSQLAFVGETTTWLGNGDWVEAGAGAARGAAFARWGEDWIAVGGEREGRPITAVRKLSSSETGLKWTDLPSLPEGLTGAAAAVIADRLYVFGGVTASGRPDNRLWILELKNPARWIPGPDLPAVPRAFAAATEQYGMLCVFGGNDADGQRLSETWVYRPQPLEGTTENGWRKMADVPAPPAIGTQALPMGQAQVLLVSPQQATLFHTLTDAWRDFEFAPGLANLSAARVGNKVHVVGSDSQGRPSALTLEIANTVRSLSVLDYALIALYFALISGIGLYFSRKQDTSAEFSLGNRQVKWWAAGISMFATGASAISFIAIPALAFSTNLVWLFPLVALIPGYFVTAHCIYPMLRRLEIASTYEYLERRFSPTLRVIASLQAIIFQSFARAAVVLLLPSLAISSVTGINVFASVLIMGIITTIYTALGGFEAVIWTEVLQAALMLFAPLAIIWICITSLPGGFSEFWSTGMAYSKFDFAMLTWDMTLPAVWMLVLGTFLTTTVASAGDQPVIQRVFSAPLPEVRRVNATFTVCGIIIGIMVNVMGIAIFAYFRARPEMLDPLSQNDQVVPIFVTQAMPMGLPGIVIAAIFAAAMSTVASSMNSVATIFTEDFFVRMRPQSTDRQRLLSLKITSYLVGIIGTVMALVLASQDLKSMMVVWNQMVALVGGGIVGVYSLGMFTRRANGFGAICGAIASVLVTLVVKLWTPLHWGTYVPIAILSCILFGYLFSLFAPQRRNLTGLTVFTPASPTM